MEGVDPHTARLVIRHRALTVSQIWCFSGFMPSTGSAILLLIVELLILELGNKVAIYVIEVPDPLGTRSVPVLVRVSIGDRIEI